MYYTNKPIEKTTAPICENPSKDIVNLIKGLPIHAIEEKVFFDNPGERAARNYDTNYTQLTDGKFSPDNVYSNEEWFHFNRGGGRIITFKLPCLSAISSFSISCLRLDSMGIRTPRYLKIRVSADGENFMTVYDNPDSRTTRDKRAHKLTGSFEPVQALYVQVVIEVLQHVYIDEIEVFGCTDISEAAVPVANDIPLFYDDPEPEEVNAFPDADVLGARNIALSYNYRPAAEDLGLKTVDDYLPLIAYLDKDGKILDTFMDGVLYLPDVSFDVDAKGAYCAEGWRLYVDSLFTPDKNVDALNKTVGIVNEALGTPDYKVAVYYTLLYTFTTHDVFGVLEDGQPPIVFESFESRKNGIKWMIDTTIRRHKEGNYNNTELKGFYWFEEQLDPCDRYEDALLTWACEYIHSLGYKCFWIPYYNAVGCTNWKKFGLDCACMQPNYAFEEMPKQRLYDTAALSKKVGMCVELEIWKVQEDENGNIDNPCHIERFFDYLNVGVETGYMYAPKIYYFGSAIGNCISNGWKSKNARYREMYDATYLYAKEKLELKK